MNFHDNRFFLGCKLSKLVGDSNWLDNSQPLYKSLLAKFVCDEPDEDCYYRICEKCPQASSVIDALNKIFEANEINNVNYKMWTATNHCTLIQVACTTEQFLDYFLD